MGSHMFRNLTVLQGLHANDIHSTFHYQKSPLNLFKVTR